MILKSEEEKGEDDDDEKEIIVLIQAEPMENFYDTMILPEYGNSYDQLLVRCLCSLCVQDP